MPKLKHLTVNWGNWRLETSNILNHLLVGLGDLPSLKDLKILSCDIDSSWPQGLGRLPQLEQLTIEGNIHHLPQGLGKLPNLSQLTISGHIHDLPQGLGELPKLQELIIHRDLKNLPQGLGNLLNLERLTIRSQTIENLPQGLGMLPQLTHLTIDPENIMLFKIMIRYSEREAHSFLLSLGMDKLLSLTHLTINGYFLGLPKGLDKLSHLTHLTIVGYLGYIPEGVLTLPHLTHLTLECYSGKELGYVKRRFSHLTGDIRDLPPDLNKLPALTHLIFNNYVYYADELTTLINPKN